MKSINRGGERCSSSFSHLWHEESLINPTTSSVQGEGNVKDALGKPWRVPAKD